LENNPQIALIVQLLDIRHPPSPEDLQMIDWCVSRCLPTLFVLTKLDKIPSTKQHSTIQAFTKTLEQFVENPAVIAYTIKDAQCQKRLLTLIQKALS
jgi:GTP-binding protein